MVDARVTPSPLTVALHRFDVPEAYISDALDLLPPHCEAAMIYGSRARGDHRPDSDLDVLALVDSPRGSRSSGRVSVSCYTGAQLRSASGSLFGMHLRRDGKVLIDPDGVLQAILHDLRDPDPQDLFDRVNHFSALLGVDRADARNHLPGLVRLGRYLLRTAVYAEAIKTGNPCFSVAELAVRFEDPALEQILDSSPLANPDPTADDLSDLRRRLERWTGPSPSAPWSTLAQWAVAEWSTDRMRATLATLALGGSEEPFDYSELPKVTL
ncbi:MAG TPA: nucleotidyltransferase domain-containing protein [Acidimicrobiales bacterium]|nr:nucleotidyltransferase domain-containing protein [Acidimicrobiales bacterium]